MLLLRVIRAGSRQLLQQSINGDFTTLRPLVPAHPDVALTPAHCLFLLGTPTQHTAYLLDSLLQSPAIVSPEADFMAGKDADDAEYLGQSTPLPEILHIDLSDAQYEALVLRMLGLQTDHVPDEVKDALSSILRDSGYAIAAPSAVSPLLTEAVNTRRQAAAQSATHPETAAQSATHLETAAQGEYHIHKMSPDEQEALMARTRKRDENPPKRWPWSKMEVWDKVVIPAPLAVKAQRAVHAYSAISGKLYRTKRMDNGDLVVARLDGTKAPKRLRAF